MFTNGKFRNSSLAEKGKRLLSVVCLVIFLLILLAFINLVDRRFEENYKIKGGIRSKLISEDIAKGLRTEDGRRIYSDPLTGCVYFQSESGMIESPRFAADGKQMGCKIN
jgi:hypothetical protein